MRLDDKRSSSPSVEFNNDLKPKQVLSKKPGTGAKHKRVKSDIPDNPKKNTSNALHI
jgi:hypothetical protein